MAERTWTPTLVRERLIDAFRVLPGAPVHTRREVRRPFSTVAGAGTVVAALNWPARFLADDPDGWRFLLAWAQCRASGEVIEERRREMGWSHKRFQTGHRRAAATVAAGLNRERTNLAAIAAATEARGRLADRLAGATAAA